MSRRFKNLKNASFDDKFREWIAGMDDYEYESLIREMEYIRANDSYESAKSDALETLEYFRAKPDEAAILAPWLEEGSCRTLNCSEWVRKARSYGFGEGMDTASARRVLLRKIKPLVNDRIFIRTIKGYRFTPSVRSVIRNMTEFSEMEKIARKSDFSGRSPKSDGSR